MFHSTFGLYDGDVARRFELDCPWEELPIGHFKILVDFGCSAVAAGFLTEDRFAIGLPAG